MVSIDLPALDNSYKCDHIKCNLFFSGFLRHIFEVHPNHSTYKYFSPFYAKKSSPVWTEHVLFVRSRAKRHLCCSCLCCCCCCSVAKSCPALRPHQLQHTRLPCPSPSPGVYSRRCHLTISLSVAHFSSYLQSFNHQGLFQ